MQMLWKYYKHLYQNKISQDTRVGFYMSFLNVLDVTPGGLAGDYNGNGVLDAADYTIWQEALGGTTLLNDPTPGTVDTSDYAYWKANFGVTSGSGTSASTNIPEPSSLLLTAFWLLGQLLWQHDKPKP